MMLEGKMPFQPQLMMNAGGNASNTSGGTV